MQNINSNNWVLGPGGLKSLVGYLINPKILFKLDVNCNRLGTEGTYILGTFLLVNCPFLVYFIFF